MEEKAEQYHKKGLNLVNAGKFQEAVALFSKAIEVDPFFANAYHHRGEAYLVLNRLVEGNTDLQKAKDIRSGKLRKKNKGKTVKLNLHEVDSIYDKVFPDDGEGENDATLEFGNDFYDYVFSDDEIKDEDAWEGIVHPPEKQKGFPAILEFIGGKRIEVAGAILFSPTDRDISLLRQDGYVERVIPIEQVTCIRMAGMPKNYGKKLNDSCHIEIIETDDGNIFHVAIHPDQEMDHILCGFSTKEETQFLHTFIPVANIKKRCQERYLGDILVEKRFIANDIFKQALEEYQLTKSMKLGKILAQKAQILYSTVETELEKAKNGNVQGLKTGEILLASGLVNEEQVLEALEYQENLQNMKIGEFLIDKGVIQEKEIYIALAEKFRMEFVDLRTQKVSKQILTYLPKKFVLENEVLPLALKEGTLTVATFRPEIASLCESVLKACKCQNVHCVIAQPTHLKNIINLLYKKIGLGN